VERRGTFFVFSCIRARVKTVLHVMHSPVPAASGAAWQTVRHTADAGGLAPVKNGAGARKTCTIRTVFLIRVRQARVHLLQLPLSASKAF